MFCYHVKSKINDLKISQYLENRENNKWNCRECSRVLTWSKEQLASHKRSSFPAATVDKERKFLKRPRRFFKKQNQAQLIVLFSNYQPKKYRKSTQSWKNFSFADRFYFVPLKLNSSKNLLQTNEFKTLSHP